MADTSNCSACSVGQFGSSTEVDDVNDAIGLHDVRNGDFADAALLALK